MNTQLNTHRSMRVVPTHTAPESRATQYFRSVLIMVTFVAFIYVASDYARLVGEWRRAAEPVDAKPTAAGALTPFGGALALDGPWEFDGVDWQVRTSVLSADEVDARLSKLAAVPQADASSYVEVGPDVLKLIDALRLQPVECGDYQLYRVDRANLKAQIWTRTVSGRVQAVAFAAACAQGDQRWQMFELLPQPLWSARGPVEDAHLLPLPAGAMRRGARFADDGRLLLELISLTSDSATLVAAWQAAGWEVRPSGFGNGEGFSCLCRRGNEVVYAWSADPASALESVMLVDSPASLPQMSAAGGHPSVAACPTDCWNAKSGKTVRTFGQGSLGTFLKGFALHAE